MLTRNWRFVGVFTLFSVAVAVAAPPAVHPKTGEPLVITCLRGTPDAIDGDLGDWSLDAMTPAVLDVVEQINTGQASWTGSADCSGKFYLMWDDKNIYVAVVVKDDKLSMNKTNGDIWNADCVEVFFGTTNAVPPHAEHYQYGFNANNQKWNWCNMDSAGQALPDYVQIASSRTADGYICEAAIEYGRMSALNFSAGNAIGFHPVLDDTDATDREIQMTWTSREAHDQSLGFGHLILSSDAAIPKELGRSPSPKNGAVDVPLDTVLSWISGKFAAGHDVYFGTMFADVNEATRTDPRGVLAGQGRAATEFPPAGLTYGQTYYWRVDEVNAAPDQTIFQGQTWSFTTEPFGYPITHVTATASSSQMNGMGPDKTVDGSGLDNNDLHGTGGTTMWLSAGTPPNWIQYEFDKVYQLFDLKVWNSNGPAESIVGFGAKDVTIEYSTDGTSWTALDNVPEFARGPGMADYAANTTVGFGGVMAQYVRLTINSNWGGVSNSAGLSEVRFSYVPVQAFAPQPAAGATGVGLDAGLSWRPGREARSHQVFLGTDQAAVAAGSVAARAVTEPSYVPGGLTFGTTYYWKVDEVNAITYPGDLWSFTTQEYAVVDDFESYNDDDNCVFDAWIDGYTDSQSGSIVGYWDAPFTEQTIVHSGRQSMPFEYNNVKAPYYSEASRTFDTAQNWTTDGADTLSLYFQGRAASATTPANGPAPLYLTVEDKAGKTKTVVNPNPSASTATVWTEWRIALSDLTGVNLAAVKKVTLGVGDKVSPKAGAAGMLYFDDIGYGHPAK